MSTQTNRSFAETTARQGPVVVVGVDGSAHNQAAITWASNEAKETGGRLVLVSASHEYTPPTPRFSSDYADQIFVDETRKVLERVRSDLGADEQAVSTVVGQGSARDVLILAAERADLLVVGQRGLGAVKRALVGSNSVAVAGRSPVPTIVVPDPWEGTSKSGSPIFVGLDLSGTDSDTLSFAFDRARRLGVPLVALHAWQLPAILSWSPEDLGAWNDSAKAAVRNALDPYQARYPEVETLTLTPDADAAMSLAATGAMAQLIVLGRHTAPRHVGGFHLGPTSRAVLHDATCPVAIVPSAGGSPSSALDDEPQASLPEF